MKHTNLRAVVFTLMFEAVFSFTHVVTLDVVMSSGGRSSSSVKRRLTTLFYAESDKTNNGKLSKKAYNDDALFQFHMMTQRQKIRDYSAMDSYINTESLWNLAWHDSFVRNGLMDFVPPLTDSLNVMVVGSKYQGPSASGEIEGMRDEKSSTLVEINKVELETDTDSAFTAKVALDESSYVERPQDSSCSFLAAVFDDSSNQNEKSSSTELQFNSYDCIMDKGVMADLCTSIDDDDSSNNYKNKKDMARLLYEATRRIRECGIYVANTPPMSSETKEYLNKLGEYLGLQWEFDLDGISDDQLSVSVARKFGSCPTIGWQSMAKMIED